MELNEELNNKYKEDKKAYENLKQFEEKIKSMKHEYKMEKRKQEDAIIAKNRAIEDNDTTKEQEAQIKLNEATKKMEEISQNVRKIQGVIAKSKETVDSYINELNQNPEFKKQINYILKKRYERGIEKVNKEKEQADLIIDICTQHPSLENNLKGIIRAVEELDKIKEEREKIEGKLSELFPISPANQAEYSSLIDEKNKLAKKESDYTEKRKINKESFMTFCKNANVNIDEDILDKIVTEKRFTHDGKGDIQALKSLKRISKGYDKQKNAYQKAIEKVSDKRESNNQARSNSNGNTVGRVNGANRQENNLPERTYKWYQFGKRFKAWREKRKSQRTSNTNNSVEQENSKFGSEKFKDAYKYDIVKDYVDKKESEILSEAGKNVRRESRNDNER